MVTEKESQLFYFADGVRAHAERDDVCSDQEHLLYTRELPTRRLCRRARGVATLYAAQ